MSYIEYVLENSKDFLNDFINKKIHDICNHITLFYNYLSIPRDGYKLVKTPFWVNTPKCIHILNDNERTKRKTTNLRCERPVINKFFCDLHLNSQLEDNVTSEDVSTKRINKELVTYLFNEIYNCGNFTTTTNIVEFAGREKQHIFTMIYNQIDSSLDMSIKEILYKYYLKDNEVIILRDVENLIKKYVAICIYNMIFIDIGVDNLAFKYTEMQQYVLNFKRDYKDYNLDNDKYNYSLQAFVYVITALLDWLELDDVTIDEVETAFNFILLPSFKNKIDKLKYKNRANLNDLKGKADFITKFNMYKSNINLAFKELNFDCEEDVCELILEYILLLNNLAALDEYCNLYYSEDMDVKNLHKMLRDMYEGCYNFEFRYNEYNDNLDLFIDGDMKLNYLNKFTQYKSSKKTVKTTFVLNYSSENLIMFYNQDKNIIEDVYFTPDRVAESGEFVKQFYNNVTRVYAKLIFVD